MTDEKLNQSEFKSTLLATELFDRVKKIPFGDLKEFWVENLSRFLPLNQDTPQLIWQGLNSLPQSDSNEIKVVYHTKEPVEESLVSENAQTDQITAAFLTVTTDTNDLEEVTLENEIKISAQHHRLVRQRTNLARALIIPELVSAKTPADISFFRECRTLTVSKGNFKKFFEKIYKRRIY
jgi:hypothetical protein